MIGTLGVFFLLPQSNWIFYIYLFSCVVFFSAPSLLSFTIIIIISSENLRIFFFCSTSFSPIFTSKMDKKKRREKCLNKIMSLHKNCEFSLLAYFFFLFFHRRCCMLFFARYVLASARYFITFNSLNDENKPL